MKIAVWTVSALAAVAFLLIGLGKLLPSTADLEAASQGVPVILLRIAGTAEVLGAIALILPAATRVLPVLTPVAASGLVITMIGAVTTNIIIGEFAVAVLPAVLGVMAAFIAWARFGPQAVEPRVAREPVPS
ncbi:MAG: DoxX family protein [Nocardioidaceae bacterium]